MRRLITVTALVALTSVAPAAAITNGSPDGEGHPNVSAGRSPARTFTGSA